MEYKAREDGGRTRKVREAVAPYITLADHAQGLAATTRLSAKNQITLPVAMVRRLGLKGGDEVDLTVYDGAIEVRKRLEGKNLLDWLQGALSDVPEWQTDDSIDAYVRGERDSWDREWDTE
jgi:AbrB family looped-hinge helix DNA binding protein